MSKNLAKNVTKEQVLAAINHIDKSQTSLNPSTRYDLVYNGKKYPPKDVVRTAATLAGIADLNQYRIAGGPYTNEPLTEMGFVIQPKNGATFQVETPHQLMDLLVDFLDKTNPRAVFGNYTFKEKSTTEVRGSVGGSWNPVQYPGYIFENNEAQWLFRFIKADTSAYIIVESLHRGAQLTNFDIVLNKNFQVKEEIVYVFENYKMTVGVKQSREKARGAMIKAGFPQDNTIFILDQLDPDIKLILESLLRWAEIKQQAKDSIRNSANSAIKEPEIDPAINDKEDLALPNLNIILYGPPGTGKTYSTIDKALEIVDPFFYQTHKGGDRNKLTHRFRELLIKDWESPEGRISFVTFHQNTSYQEFIEGIKPVVSEEGDQENIAYEIKEGIFKLMAQKATWRKGNFDKVFDEFKESINEFKEKRPITIEAKGTTFDVIYREGAALYVKPKAAIRKDKSYPVSIVNIRKVYETGSYEGIYNPTYVREILQYLKRTKGLIEPNEKATEEPEPHVLIIDEINRGNVAEVFGELITLLEADKRLGAKEELKVVLPYTQQLFGVPANLYIIGTMNAADRGVEALDTALRRRFYFEEMEPQPGLLDKVKLEDIDFVNLLNSINERIVALHSRDYCIGHAYFINIKTMEDLKHAFFNKLIPLLQEYFYKDYGRIGLILGEGFLSIKEKGKIQFKSVKGYDTEDLREGYSYHLKDEADFENDLLFVEAVKSVYGQ